MVGACKTLSAFGSKGCPHYRAFASFVVTLGKPYGIRLVIPTLDGDDGAARLSFLKKFCSGLLEKEPHPWRRQISRLSADSRMSISMSLFLFRKVLPSPEPDLVAYAEKLSKPSPEPSSEFLKYVRKHIPRMFPRGWDKELYPSACLNAVLPFSSCVERGRGNGGCRMEAIGSTENLSLDRDKFVTEVLTRTDPIVIPPSRLTSVETGGKHRIVSVPGINMNYLRPLHTAIYNRLSRFDWLLRGKEKPARFSRFVKKEGEIFVSGDYESATDNLNSILQKEILELILGQSTQVPEAVSRLAVESLSLRLDCNGLVYQQKSGQLMGNLVSFPLLCIVNYLAFRWKVGRDAPVKVNGDDIVFRARPEVARKWTDAVSRAGLTLSKGKTMYHSHYFSLNSSIFKATTSTVVIIPFLRASAFGFRSDCGGVETLKGRFNSFCPGFSGIRKSDLRVDWLKWNRKWIDSSNRSITRGLGLSAKHDEMIRAGLWDREAWYLSLEVERPLPVQLNRFEQDQFKDFKLHRVFKITKRMREASKGVAAAFVEAAWNPVSLRCDIPDWKQEVVRDTFDWMPWFKQRQGTLIRRSRLLGLSIPNTRRFLSPSFDRTLRSRAESYKNQRESVWLPLGFRTSEFVKA